MSSTKSTPQSDSDVRMTLEDQQKINKYVRLNEKVDVIKQEIKVKENDLKKLQDASDEMLLLDEHEVIRCMVGEVYLYKEVKVAQTYLEESKTKTESEIAVLKSKLGEIKDLMNELKTYLYGKFGNKIDLETDD